MISDFKLELDAGTGIAFGAVRGTLTLDDARRSAREMADLTGFDGSAIVWDLREASFSLSGDQVRRLAEFVQERSALRPPARMAFIVAGDLEFGLLRMFEVYRAEPGIEVRTFREPNAATQWVSRNEAD